MKPCLGARDQVSVTGELPVRTGSLYYTDDWFAYTSLPIRGNHVVVLKKKGIPKGQNHIKGIEGFWSFAKHWLYQYRGIDQSYFYLYLKEVEWRFNHRNENLVILLRRLLNQQIQLSKNKFSAIKFSYYLNY